MSEIVRQVKGDTPDYKNVIFMFSEYGFYVEIYQRRRDMSQPKLQVNIFNGDRTVLQTRAMVALLEAAANEVDRWCELGALLWGTSMRALGAEVKTKISGTSKKRRAS